MAKDLPGLRFESALCHAFIPISGTVRIRMGTEWNAVWPGARSAGIPQCGKEEQQSEQAMVRDHMRTRPVLPPARLLNRISAAG